MASLTINEMQYIIIENTKTCCRCPGEKITVPYSLDQGKWVARALLWKIKGLGSYKTIFTEIAESPTLALEKLLDTSAKATNNFFTENGLSGSLSGGIICSPTADTDMISVDIKTQPESRPLQKQGPSRPPPSSSPRHTIKPKGRQDVHAVAPFRRGHKVLCIDVEAEGIGCFKFVDRIKPTQSNIKDRVLAAMHSHFPASLEGASENPMDDFLVSIRAVELLNEEFELGNLGEDLSPLFAGKAIPRFFVTVEKMPQPLEEEDDGQDENGDAKYEYQETEDEEEEEKDEKADVMAPGQENHD